MEKINIAEILKDCPTGMELDCTIFDDVHFDFIDDVCDIINCYIQDSTNKIGISFDKYGHYSSLSKSKCAIFPKGKTTWKGFQRPFKDGDICCVNFDNYYENIFIFKEISEHNYIRRYVNLHCNSLLTDDSTVCKINKGFRHATEEEKEKLFKAIKANGYKWNAETKTLEKLIKPKFKVGDRVKHSRVKDSNIYRVVGIVNSKYEVTTDNGEHGYHIDFETQCDWELVPNKFDISTLKPFDKVLVRIFHKEEWKADFFSHYTKDADHPFVTVGKHALCYCIPYENNEHLLGKTDDCDEYYKTWE